MPNTREKLIELLSIGHECPDGRNPFLEESCSTCPYGKAENCGAEMQADRLIASGFIEELQNEAYDVGVDSALHNHFGLSWEDAAGLRKEITRLQEATKWIPVGEELPPKNETVLVYCKNKTIQGGTTRHIGSCDNGFWFLKTQPGTESFPHLEWEVTHWMPLPEPPNNG